MVLKIKIRKDWKESKFFKWLKSELFRIMIILSSLFCIWLFFQGIKYGIWGVIVASILIAGIRIAMQWEMYKSMIISSSDFIYYKNQLKKKHKEKNK